MMFLSEIVISTAVCKTTLCAGAGCRGSPLLHPSETWCRLHKTAYRAQRLPSVKTALCVRVPSAQDRIAKAEPWSPLRYGRCGTDVRRTSRTPRRVPEGRTHHLWWCICAHRVKLGGQTSDTFTQKNQLHRNRSTLCQHFLFSAVSGTRYSFFGTMLHSFRIRITSSLHCSDCRAAFSIRSSSSCSK